MNRLEAGQDVHVVLGAANGQTDGVQRAKCSTKECVEIGTPRGAMIRCRLQVENTM